MQMSLPVILVSQKQFQGSFVAAHFVHARGKDDPAFLSVDSACLSLDSACL